MKLFFVSAVAFLLTLIGLTMCKTSGAARAIGILGTALFVIPAVLVTFTLFALSGSMGGDNGYSIALSALVVIGPSALFLVGVTWLRAKELPPEMMKGTSYCQACGYDLRGTPSGECPECGEQNPVE